MADDKPVEKKWSELLKPQTDIEAGTPKSYAVLKETVPIIFVPGIMGTRLKRASSGDKVWDPDAKGFMLKEYGMFYVDAADKKRKIVGDEFDKDDLVPFADDPKHNQKFATVEGAAQRGWGTIAWGTYGEILQALNNPQTWPAPVRAFFDLPVYACGYNWGASNVDGAKALNKFIDKVIEENREPKKPKGWCEKVILVTHSMGGLVTRQAVQFGKQAKILGVVHGVQPALGAAAAYWRMKAGFERGAGGLLPNPTAWVLGTNGAEVTALLGWLPGGLQLLPGPKYTDNDGDKQWLQFADEEGNVKLKLPKSDACSEIYLNENEDDYWRLVKKEYLLPEKKPKVPAAAAWSAFRTKVVEAKAFHTALGTFSHPETFSFYGSGKWHPTADRIVYKLSPKGWKDGAWEQFKLAQDIRDVAPKYLELAGNLTKAAGALWGIGGFIFDLFKKTEYWESRGGFKTKFETPNGDVEVELQQPDGAGDGTVSESSGKAIRQSGAASGGGAAKAFQGIEHEPAYHADQRGLLKKGWDAVKGLFGAMDEPSDENTVTFTSGAVEKMLRLKIKNARK